MPVKVKDVMQEPAILVRPDDTIERVAHVMLLERVPCVAVVDSDGRILGGIHDEDFNPAQRSLPFSTERAPQLFGEWTQLDRVERDYASARSRPARLIMRHNASVISEDARLSEALPSLQHGQSLIVVRGERPVGTLNRHDLLKLACRD